MKKIAGFLAVVLWFTRIAVVALIGHLAFFPAEEFPEWPPVLTVLTICTVVLLLRHVVWCWSLVRRLRKDRGIRRMQIQSGETSIFGPTLIPDPGTGVPINRALAGKDQVHGVLERFRAYMKGLETLVPGNQERFQEPGQNDGGRRLKDRVLMKAYRITPSWNSDYDSIVVPAGETWGPALEHVEMTLETLFLDAEAQGLPWSSIGPVTVECVEISDEEMAELTQEDQG